MRTLLEQFALATVTFATDLADFLDARRRGTMVAVACDARRRAEVALLEQKVRMMARLVLSDHIRRDLVLRHQLRVAVATTASIGDIGWVHVALRRFHLVNIVCAVAIGTSGDILVAFSE